MPHPPGRASKAAKSPRPGHTRAQEVWKQSAHTKLQGNRVTPSDKGCSVRSLLSPASSVGQQKGKETPSAKAGPAMEAGLLDRAGARGRGQLEFPPGTCSQSVPTGISSVMPARTCTFHLLSSAHNIWSLGLQWTLTNVTPAGCEREETFLKKGGGGACRFWRQQGQRGLEGRWRGPHMDRRHPCCVRRTQMEQPPSASAAACPEGQRGRDRPESRRTPEVHIGSCTGTGRWWPWAATEEAGVATVHASA